MAIRWQSKVQGWYNYFSNSQKRMQLAVFLRDRETNASELHQKNTPRELFLKMPMIPYLKNMDIMVTSVKIQVNSLSIAKFTYLLNSYFGEVFTGNSHPCKLNVSERLFLHFQTWFGLTPGILWFQEGYVVGEIAWR